MSSVDARSWYERTLKIALAMELGKPQPRRRDRARAGRSGAQAPQLIARGPAVVRGGQTAWGGGFNVGGGFAIGRPGTLRTIQDDRFIPPPRQLRPVRSSSPGRAGRRSRYPFDPADPTAQARQARAVSATGGGGVGPPPPPPPPAVPGTTFSPGGIPGLAER